MITGYLPAIHEYIKPFIFKVKAPFFGLIHVVSCWPAIVGLNAGRGFAERPPILLEVARVLQKLDRKPRRTVRFALWGGEEQGLIGSTSYVKAHRGSDLSHCVTVVNSDDGSGHPWAGSCTGGSMSRMRCGRYRTKSLANTPATNPRIEIEPELLDWTTGDGPVLQEYPVISMNTRNDSASPTSPKPRLLSR